MRAAWLLLVVLLGGCALVSQVPSLRYCDSVKYERSGRSIEISAHCFEAVEPAFPIPLPVHP